MPHNEMNSFIRSLVIHAITSYRIQIGMNFIYKPWPYQFYLIQRVDYSLPCLKVKDDN